jgi:uncharacterized flavoprotein (TIGR03862 family)
VQEKTWDIIVVGGGPAGLRAAELVSAAGLRTLLADHKPSVGRKFLVAGRGGLNLTHSEPVENFPARYGDASERWQGLLKDFSPDDLRAWAKELGIETFIGTSGRVFPESKQAAPLLRRWIGRLRKQGVSFRPRHELKSFQRAKDHWEVMFSSSQGEVALQAYAIVFALGGASWPETGSDGTWAKLFAQAGIAIKPLAAANCGYEVDWPASFLTEAEGQPLKNIAVTAGRQTVAGELLITKYGLEGGAVYQLGRTLRGMAQPQIGIDLKPSLAEEDMLRKLESFTEKTDVLAKAVKAWRLGPVAYALLRSRGNFDSALSLVRLTKKFPVQLRGPRPIEEAISSAGGVAWEELNDDLMLKRHPGLFCAGEMIDWDAPTGGYLLQGCFSTATRVARGAQKFLTELTELRNF